MPGDSWGVAAAIAIGATIPVAYLVLEQLPATREWAHDSGPNYSGIAAYVCAGAAMVVGSLLKPRATAQD